MKLTQKSLNEQVRAMIRQTGVLPDIEGGAEQKMPRLMEFIRRRGSPLTPPSGEIPLPKEAMPEEELPFAPVTPKVKGKKYPFLTGKLE